MGLPSDTEGQLVIGVSSMSEEKSPETFTKEEEEILSPYVTNLREPIFALTNALPQVVAGAGFSRYSRSRKSLRRVLLDEFLKDTDLGIKNIRDFIVDVTRRLDPAKTIDSSTALQIAIGVYKQLLDPTESIRSGEEFYSRVLEQYGDESVNELMGAHIAFEGVSNIVTKILEDPRLLSPLEKSTRYVVFEADNFYKEPQIMASEHRELYESTNRLLLSTYSDLLDPLREFLRGKSPRGEFPFQIERDSEPLKIKDIKDEAVLEQAISAYNRTIRGKYCDILRYLLPGSTLTNVGVFANGRSHEHLITELFANELFESRRIAESYLDEIRKVIPAAVERVKKRHGQMAIEFMKNRRSARAKFASELELGPVEDSDPVTLIRCTDRQTAEVAVVTALLYEDRNEPWEQIEGYVQKMGQEERRRAIKQVLSSRTNYRHKPPRAFEFTDYVFELLADYGAYRDLQRHRMLTQERQLLTPLHGYDTPEELLEADGAIPEVKFKERFDRSMEKSAQAAQTIAVDLPLESQYAVAFGYRIRWVVKMHLREAYHLCELRSGRAGHRSYRRLAQKIAAKIGEIHPILAEHMIIDWEEYDYERYSAEVRTAQKILARKAADSKH